MKRKRRESVTEAVPYKPTAQEEAVVCNFVKRRTAEMATQIKLTNENGAPRIVVNHKEKAVGYALLAEALGTANMDFINVLVQQLADGGSQGKIDENEINFMLAVIKDIKPTDHVIAMLGAQMAAVHITAMKFMQRFPRIESLQQQDATERAYNKLVRTFTMQMEALRRYRTGGEQKVTVQYVSVADGGQAIVGPVTQAAPQAAPSKHRDKPKALIHSQQAPMPIIDNPVPRPRAARMGAKR
jgi:hypothetical protein